MHFLFSPFVLDHILDIYLVLVFKLLDLPCSCVVNTYGKVLCTNFNEVFVSFLWYRVKFSQFKLAINSVTEPKWHNIYHRTLENLGVLHRLHTACKVMAKNVVNHNLQNVL